jgi:hypothetical protein
MNGNLCTIIGDLQISLIVKVLKKGADALFPLAKESIQAV